MSAFASASDASSDNTTWLYIDDDGVERGPFNSAQMAAWLEQGYFSPDQPCKPLSAASFQPLSAYFPPAMQPPPQPHTQGRRSDSGVQLNEQHGSTVKQYTAEVGGRGDSETAQQAASSAASEDEKGTGGEDGREEKKQSGRQEQDADLKQYDLGYDEEKDVDEEDEEQSSEVAARLAALKESSGRQPADLSATARGESEIETQHHWHYVDDSGALQGPFPSSHMRAWHAAGYFKPDTKVRRDDESELTALRHRQHTDFIANTPATAATAATAVAPSTAVSSSAQSSASRPSFHFYTPRAGESDWYYTDRAGIERGPFSTSLMRHWHSKGYFTYNDCPIRAAHTAQSASAPLRLHSRPPDFVLPPHHPSAAIHPLRRTQADEQWLYIDSGGLQQGPFSTAAMAQWWRAGYLPPNTQVKRAGEQQWSAIADRGQQCSLVQQAAMASGAAQMANQRYSQPAST